MKALLLVIKSNFRNRKLMTFLTGSSIALATLLFSCGMSILESIQEPFDRLFNKLNASHILLLYDVNDHNTQEFRNWFVLQPETERVGEACPYFLCEGPLFYKGSKIELKVQITEFNIDNSVQDKLMILDGIQKKRPGHGEIWLPKYLANNHHLQIGDTIGIPGPGGLYPVIISATIADPHYGSGMINPTRAWVAAGELPFFVPVTQLSKTMLGVRLKNPDSISVLWGRFNRQFTYSGVNLTYSVFKNAYMGIYQIMGNIIAIFSVLALFIGLFMVRASIKRAIYDDYKLMGVFKTLGFTPMNIVSLYVMQYLLLVMIFIPVALVGTHFITQFLLSTISNKLGALELAGLSQHKIYFVSFIIVAAMVAITAFLGSLNASKINPVEAIRTGAPVKRFSKFLLPKEIANSKLALPVIMGLRFFSTNPRRSLSQGFIIMVSFFIIIFSINVSSSFENLKYNKPAWGFENGDIQLTRKEAVLLGIKHEQLMEMLRQEKIIHRIVPFSYESLSVLSKEDLPKMEIYGKVYSDSLSHAGLLNLQGRHPQSPNEISLCIGTARQCNKRPGDTIPVFIEGQKTSFIVTGIYQDVSNFGQGFRLYANALKKLNPIYAPSIYSIKLEENNNAKDYENVLLKKFGETISIDARIEDRIAQMGIISGMKTSLFALSLLFILIMLLSIGNDMLISLKENEKQFGILKSIGWTPKQIRLSMLCKTLYITAIALLLAIPLGFWLSPLLMGEITGGVGLIKFPITIDYPGLLMAIPLTLALISGCLWWLSRSTTFTNPRTLINS